jgi:hypothetical protein
MAAEKRPMDVGPEVSRAIREMEGHLRAAIEVAQALDTVVERAQAFHWLAEMVERISASWSDVEGTHERRSLLREVMSLRAAAFEDLRAEGRSYAQAAEVIGLTKGGFQSVLTRETKRNAT